jgi:hypothetical protein
MSNERSMGREKALAEVSRRPLMRDAVYHSAKFGPPNKLKEVCDILLLHRGQAVVISVKNQDVKRNEAKTEKWINKNGPSAIAQLHGACRTIQTTPFWCEHYTGRVHFEPGDISPCHKIALLETDYEVMLKDVEYRGNASIPLTVMSVDNFVYLIGYLRTFNDFASYLNRRSAALTEEHWRRLGCEHYYFSYYTAHRDSFEGFEGIEHAKRVIEEGRHVIDGSAFRDQERTLASIVEQFMSESETAGTDSPPFGHRANSSDLVDNQARLLIQLRSDLSELLVQERAEIGLQIAKLCEKAVREGDGGYYGAVRSPRFADTVFLCMVCQGRTQEQAWIDGMDVLLAACAHFAKRNGILLMMVAVDDKHIKKFGQVRDFCSTPEYISAGQEYFGNHSKQRISSLR